MHCVEWTQLFSHIKNSINIFKFYYNNTLNGSFLDNTFPTRLA